jgi:hypothetical protein
MRNWTLLFSLLTFLSFAIYAKAGEPRWLPPLADGQVPPCPEHEGTRSLRSEVVSSHSFTVSISASAVRSSGGCAFHIELDTARGARAKSIRLGNNHKFEFSVIDFLLTVPVCFWTKCLRLFPQTLVT